jgi:cytochrome c553
VTRYFSTPPNGEDVISRVLRWLRIGLYSFVGILVAALVVVYALSERKLRRTYPAGGRDIAIPTDAASVTEGKRLAQIRGCAGGCHGQEIEGEVFVDNPLLARVVAPNLSVAMREYSTPQLEAIIRGGVRPNGRSVIIMPSDMFSPLTDQDLGKIIAYLRSVPPKTGPTREARVGPLARLMFVMGKFEPVADGVHRAAILTKEFPLPSDPNAHGAYLARTVCTECHGLDLRGQPGRSPDLSIAASYSPAQFTQLMRTGKPRVERELKLMSGVARRRFSHFTDAEIAALHKYLLARANK